MWNNRFLGLDVLPGISSRKLNKFSAGLHQASNNCHFNSWTENLTSVVWSEPQPRKKIWVLSSHWKNYSDECVWTCFILQFKNASSLHWYHSHGKEICILLVYSQEIEFLVVCLHLYKYITISIFICNSLNDE